MAWAQRNLLSASTQRANSNFHLSQLILPTKVNDLTMQLKTRVKFSMLIMLVCAVSISAYAGALLSDPAEKIQPAPKKQPTTIGTAVTGAGNVTPIVSHANAPQKMSCWQYGKLIFEQTVIAPKDKVTDMRLLHNPETGEVVLLFDFKTAFCLIK